MRDTKVSRHCVAPILKLILDWRQSIQLYSTYIIIFSNLPVLSKKHNITIFSPSPVKFLCMWHIQKWNRMCGCEAHLKF